LMSRTRPRPTGMVSHLADASTRTGDEPGLTESLRYLGSKSEVSAIGIGAYFVCIAFLTRSAMRSSARFSCIDVQSRDRSPPSGYCANLQLSASPAPTLRHSSYRARPPTGRNRGWPRSSGRSKRNSTSRLTSRCPI
jgi:hypothetical protein